MIEIWKDIPGYEGRYQVSNFGRVKSLPNIRRKSELILRQAAMKSGHLMVSLWNGNGRSRLVHALVMEAFVGPRPAGMDCCHNDGDPANNRLSNLRWDTRSGNERDKKRHGRTNAGERNGRSKLKATDVAQIKTGIRNGVSSVELAERFDVTRGAINYIKRGESWRHIA